MAFKQSNLVPGWTDSDPVVNWKLYKKHIDDCVAQGSNTPQLITYPVFSADYGANYIKASNAYSGGVLVGDKIFFSPWNQSQNPYFAWHYLDLTSGKLKLYSIWTVNNPVALAYQGAVVDQNELVWFMPSEQGNQTKWHYVDPKKNWNGPDSIITVVNGPTKTNPYRGGVFVPSLNRIYLIPFNQSNEPTWHYIDTVTKTVVGYSQNSGVTPVANAYFGGVLAPNGRIYLIPYNQASASHWHYIDTNTGNVVAYPQNSGVTPVAASAYQGGALTSNGKIYLAPSQQADEANWHYIDINTGSVVAYPNNSGVTPVSSVAYSGAIFAPDGYVYLIPYSQTTATNWHRINPVDNSVSAYAVPALIGSGSAVSGGVLAPDGRIYLMPCNGPISPSKLYCIKTNAQQNFNTTVLTSPFFNKF